MDQGDWILAGFGAALFAMALGICFFRWFVENYLPWKRKLNKQESPPSSSPVTFDSYREKVKRNKEKVKDDPQALAQRAKNEIKERELAAQAISMLAPVLREKEDFGKSIHLLINAIVLLVGARPEDSLYERTGGFFVQLALKDLFWKKFAESAGAIKDLAEDIAERYPLMNNEREAFENKGKLIQTYVTRGDRKGAGEMLGSMVSTLWASRERGDEQLSDQAYQDFFEKYKSFYGTTNPFPSLLRDALEEFLKKNDSDQSPSR